MWLRCGIRCDVEYGRYGVMLNYVILCVVHGEYGVLMQDVKCGRLIPSDVEWCDVECGVVLNNVRWCLMWNDAM